jgi:hydroxyisourate hydrolase
MGKLSTHVLDTATGRPADGMRLTLRQLHPDGAAGLVVTTITNREGRTDHPLIEGMLSIGRFELSFEAGAYFAASGTALADPPFLDEIPIRFAIADPDAHYHVPLLVSPWSYATYRGS